MQGSSLPLQAYQDRDRSQTGVARTIKLYDQTVAHLAEAQAKWEASIFDGAFAAIQQAAGTVAALSASLDHESGKEVSETLRRYYNGLSFQILSVPRQSDPVARISSLFRQIAVVREAWVQISTGSPETRSHKIRSIHGRNRIDPL